MPKSKMQTIKLDSFCEPFFAGNVVSKASLTAKAIHTPKMAVYFFISIP
jgi:hypothetical protein